MFPSRDHSFRVHAHLERFFFVSSFFVFLQKYHQTLRIVALSASIRIRFKKTINEDLERASESQREVKFQSGKIGSVLANAVNQHFLHYGIKFSSTRKCTFFYHGKHGNRPPARPPYIESSVLNRRVWVEDKVKTGPKTASGSALIRRSGNSWKVGNRLPMDSRCLHINY